ncbi:MAG TPA: undecaprenyl-diphosphatase UppP [Kofleriaceae bacterium]|nr:undecaprenyl-diphosphatase UppP [Kofleriaceae bacterium]
MALWFAALLGLVQGLTEFLPISSTAHLVIAPALLGQPDAGAAFTAVLQLGTLVAVVAYFARDLFVNIPRALLFDRGGKDARLAAHIAIGTVPIVVGGVLGKDYITGPLRSLWVVSGALAGVAVFMLWADRRGGGHRAMHELTWVHALAIGMAQACALVPGVSRSGATITCALVIGMARPDAARFSFLLGVPAIAGAGIFEMKDAFAQLGSDGWAPLALGTFTAAVAGYASIAWLLRYLQRRTLAPFCAYRVAMAALLAVLILTGLVDAVLPTG